MRILAVDDESLALRDLEQGIRQAAPGCELFCFSSPWEALRHAQEHPVDVAFLDIEMAGMDGLALAERLAERHARLNVIFVTGYAGYGKDAFGLHASGYVLKPVQPRDIGEELRHLRYEVADRPGALLRAQCFGNFEVFANGEPLRFVRKKTKELLAYLISRRGAQCDNKELAAVLWEDRLDSDKLQSNFRNLVCDLTRVLQSAQAEAVLQKGRGSLAVAADRLECDFYKLLEGTPRALSQYTGEFMAQYSWAEGIAGQLEGMRQRALREATEAGRRRAYVEPRAF